MTFDELVTRCEQCVAGQMTKEAFIKTISQEITINKYIPISTKLAWAGSCKILWENQCGYSDDTQILSLMDGSLQAAVSGYDKATFAYLWDKTKTLVCAYCDMQPDWEVIYDQKYDALKQSGFLDYLEETVGKDYQEFDKYIDWYSGIAIYPLVDMIKSVVNSLPSKEKLQEAMEQISQSKEAMDNVKQITQTLRLQK